jgi:hypothetical protein
MTPAAVSMATRSLPRSRISSWATQREALPQASTSPPSALRICMAASVLPFFGGSITMNWSQPTPVLRSATARAWASLSASGCARASMTTKSLPSPCILVKVRPLMAGL